MRDIDHLLEFIAGDSRLRDVEKQLIIRRISKLPTKDEYDAARVDLGDPPRPVTFPPESIAFNPPPAESLDEAAEQLIAAKVEIEDMLARGEGDERYTGGYLTGLRHALLVLTGDKNGWLERRAG